MELRVREEILEAVRTYRLPRYHEIPEVGLYLNQVAKYINDYLEPFTDMGITESMISNYVKKRLVSNPVKKQYSREQVAYLLVIGVVKSILSLENVGRLLELQKATYDSERAYNYFCEEFENILRFVFGITEEMEQIGEENSDVKALFRNIIVTVSHKLYLDQCFLELGEGLQTDSGLS